MSNSPNFLDEYTEGVNRRQQTFETILNDLNSNPKYNDFFNQYHPASIKNFKENYARYKTDCIEYEQLLKDVELRETLKYQDKATDCLWDIQYYKLLVVQCKWRSEEIEIPEITYTHDFFYWLVNTEKCLFITPISQNELDTYIEYLSEETSKRMFDFDDRCQMYNYEKFKEECENKEKCHPYYFYMFNLMGRDMFQLPDLKGTNEKRYFEAVNIEEQKNKPPKTDDPNEDKRPMIHTYPEDDMIPFLEYMKQPTLLAFRKIKTELDHMYSGWTYFEKAIETLQEAGDNWPVDYHQDWHYSIINAALQYEKKGVIKTIKKVYENYVWMQDNNIEFTPPSMDSFMKEFALECIERDIATINQGKKLLGEE